MHAANATTEADLFQIAAKLRDEDVAECLADGFPEPFAGLLWSCEMSEQTVTITMDGEPVGVWGYMDEQDGSCSVWCMGTDRLFANPLKMHRASLLMRDELLEYFDTIRNTVFSKNLVHIRWLERLGATFNETGDPNFLEFEIIRK